LFERGDVEEGLLLVEEGEAVDLAHAAGAVDEVQPRRMIELA